MVPEIMNLVSKIHEFKGKQELFMRAKPDILKAMLEVAKIQSTGASNRIEGIFTSDSRLEELVSKKAEPINRDEEEIAGYREVLNTIHENYDYITLKSSVILQLHRDLYSFHPSNNGGRYKNQDNIIKEVDEKGIRRIRFKPLSAFETPEAVEKLCSAYNESINDGRIDPLILISKFVLDFLSIHPFNDGNGRMSRLLTTLLLYRNGFYVGKYISLEAKIAKNKDLYYEALADSQVGWHEGKEDAIPFVKYILGTILAAYKDFEERMTIIEPKLSALEMVRRASENKIGRFNKQDIRELCSTLSDSSIEAALRKLVLSGELQKEGKGKSTCYFRVK